MYDIIIVGAGPSGMTAAIYGRRASKSVLVLEASCYGGQIINSACVENYPGFKKISGFDLATDMYNQMIDLGATFKIEKVNNIINHDDYKEVITNKESYKCRSVIIASGCSNRKLGIIDEDKYLGRGISYCATCDGNFFKGKDVCVVGGGNTAIDDALYLSNICKKVYLIHRRDEFRADLKSVSLLKEKENVEFVLNSNVTGLVGEDKLTGVIINSSDVINVSGLFVAIGSNPFTDIFSSLVDVNENGYFISCDDCSTNVKGIFVCGDNREKDLRQLVTAVSDGAIACSSAVKYLNNK